MSSTYLCQYKILLVYLLLFNMCSCSMVCMNISANIPDIGAVSYTHLDVYKRQTVKRLDLELHTTNTMANKLITELSASNQNVNRI